MSTDKHHPCSVGLFHAVPPAAAVPIAKDASSIDHLNHCSPLGVPLIFESITDLSSTLIIETKLQDFIMASSKLEVIIVSLL